MRFDRSNIVNGKRYGRMATVLLDSTGLRALYIFSPRHASVGLNEEDYNSFLKDLGGRDGVLLAHSSKGCIWELELKDVPANWEPGSRGSYQKISEGFADTEFIGSKPLDLSPIVMGDKTQAVTPEGVVFKTFRELMVAAGLDSKLHNPYASTLLDALQELGDLRITFSAKGVTYARG